MEKHATEPGRAERLRHVVEQLERLPESGANTAKTVELVASELDIDPSLLGRLIRGLSPSSPDGEPTDVDLVLSTLTSEGTRSMALRRLGVAPGVPLMVFAIAGPSEGVSALVSQIRAHAGRTASGRRDGLDVVILPALQDVNALAVPSMVSAGYALVFDALEMPRAWNRSKNALRFAVPCPRDQSSTVPSDSVIVDVAELGPYEILAEQLTPEYIAQLPDVQRLDELTKHAGPDALDMLLAVASTESVREAARLRHLHHATVGARVRSAEAVLGYSLTASYGRARLHFTLTLHRILSSHARF